MKRHLSEHEPKSDTDSYIQESELCNSIIALGVTLFLLSLIVGAVIVAVFL